ncbi:hypothetical protein BS47DRAFT_1369190 [Hydnum rufescens UP504]|uniref:Uncharacterized protein n=1 Tax=Hydnum rufescens UP504 TaxID=1448309 RepID=A0A9P6ADM2_9AGAM|nr:hypothetical protein BS47DRAFT_1369190 [Hydnum rufescens UP504]
MMQSANHGGRGDFLRQWYLCQGYAQWLMQKFLPASCENSGCLVPILASMTNNHQCCFRIGGFGGLPVSLESSEDWNEMGWYTVFAATVLERGPRWFGKEPCLKTTWRNTTNVSPRTGAQLPSCITPHDAIAGFYYHTDGEYYKEQAFSKHW